MAELRVVGGGSRGTGLLLAVFAPGKLSLALCNGDCVVARYGCLAGFDGARHAASGEAARSEPVEQFPSMGVYPIPRIGHDHGWSGGIAERMADDLFPPGWDAELGRGGSGDFDLLAGRDAQPARFFDAPVGEGGTPAGAAMGNLGCDRGGGGGDRSSASVVDSGGCCGGGCVYRAPLPAFAFLLGGAFTLGMVFCGRGNGSGIVSMDDRAGFGALPLASVWAYGSLRRGIGDGGAELANLQR